MNPLVIYHANCADGFSAAWVFHDFYEGLNKPVGFLGAELGIDFHPGVYSKPPPDCTGRTVYLVDFSYKKEVVKQICAVAAHVILIDHHKTAINDLFPLQDVASDEFQSNFSWFVDLDRSGAMLAWDYLHNPNGAKLGDYGYVQPPRLLEHVQDRDLWKFKLPRTREIQAAVFSYEYTFENWDILMGSDVVALLKLSESGAAIERKHHKDIAELIKTCQYMGVIGNSVVPMASLPYIFSSDAAHAMARDYDNGNHFAACYWDTPTGRTFSLRSTDWGMDVSVVAAHYGGGGHKHAAGFSVPSDHRLANRTMDLEFVPKVLAAVKRQDEATKLPAILKKGPSSDF